MSDPTIPAGMKPWAGGDSAPADWAVGSPVMQRDGSMYPGDIDDGLDWTHYGEEVVDGDSDIIAYTPALSTPTTPDEQSCACEVAFGQNPACASHGVNTAWRAENPEADWRDAPAWSGVAPSTEVQSAALASGKPRIAQSLHRLGLTYVQLSPVGEEVRAYLLASRGRA